MISEAYAALKGRCSTVVQTFVSSSANCLAMPSAPRFESAFGRRDRILEIRPRF